MRLLRPARSLDAGRLGAMMTEAAPHWKPMLHSGAEDIAHVGEMIARGWVTVAEQGAPVGFIAREGRYIHALFVSAAAQRAGIGRALLDAAQQAEDQLDLWTFEANAPARRFYESAGFTVVGRGTGTNNAEGLPDVQYRWQSPTPQRQERKA
ncbi:GNAT family N-acetyltransferase [Salipiger sp. 1_MG-2023]|uniref:GNAT family N-acetyltransferase n=1 Tax=Salipiger sp. 1_MG-2023 TaxID=3062665 RepID=UPI0026E3BB9D|nr:GNAT family N-acetyltransferase [Salipiger sp. 1_MG-2023]MDO6586779.1 GNAT family N-acetyltransferase [Salipiger sp. 1_MG-2023]